MSLRRLVAFLLACVLGVTLAAPANAQDRPASEASELLADVLGLVTSATQPAHDVTLLLRDLRQALPDLRGSEKRQAERILARPGGESHPCTGLLCRTDTFLSQCRTNAYSRTMDSANFRIHYNAAGQCGAADPTWVNTTRKALERSWNQLVNIRKFRTPKPDGDGRFDVYLTRIQDGYYGYCAADQATKRSTSYCVLDNSFANLGGLNGLRATAAHEFFHAIQFNYDVGEPAWLMEGSAVWAEETVFPGANDYLQYLDHSPIREYQRPIDYEGGLHMYGIGVFWIYLTRTWGDSFLRLIWGRAGGAYHGIGAVRAAAASRGLNFDSVFSRFGVWMTHPPGSYPDRKQFPPHRYWRVRPLSTASPSTGWMSTTMAHLTNHNLNVRVAGNVPGRTRLIVNIRAPQLANRYATLHVRKAKGGITVHPLRLNNTGRATISVPFAPSVAKRAVVTLTNSTDADNRPVDVRARLSW